MRENISQLKGKATSQLVYSPFQHQNFIKKYPKPPRAQELNDKQLLKEHFYLSKFIKTLQANSQMPTLPNQLLLQAIKKQNQLMQQKVQALRNSTYEQYLIRKFNNLNKQIQLFNQNQSMKQYVKNQEHSRIMYNKMSNN